MYTQEAPRATAIEPALKGGGLAHALSHVRDRVLACVVFDRLVPKGLQRQPMGARAVVEFLLFAGVEIVVLFGMTWLQGEPLRVVVLPTVLGSITTSGSVVAVALLFPYSLRVIYETVDEAGGIREGQPLFVGWAWRVTSLRRQVSVVMILLLVSLTLTASLEASQSPPFPIYWSTYVAMAAATVALGGGGYFAVVAPGGVRLLTQFSSSDLRIYRLDPGRSPVLGAVSRLISVYTWYSAVLVTLTLLTVLALNPTWGSWGTWTVFGLLCVGAGATTYLFFVPHRVLSSLIRRERDRSIRDLQSQANAILAKGEDMSSEDLERLDRLGVLIRSIADSRTSMVSWSSLRSYIGSVLTPTLTYLASQASWSALIQQVAPK